MKKILFNPKIKLMGRRCPHWMGAGEEPDEPFQSGSPAEQKLIFAINIKMKEGVAMKDPRELERLRSKISERIAKAITEAIVEAENSQAASHSISTI